MFDEILWKWEWVKNGSFVVMNVQRQELNFIQRG